MKTDNPADFAFERIATYLPEDRRVAYYQYLNRLKSFDSQDDLVVLLEGIAIYSWLTREAPALVAEERRLLSMTIEKRGQRFEEVADRVEKRFISHLECFHGQTAATSASLNSIAADFQKQMTEVTAEFNVQIGMRVKAIDRAAAGISYQNDSLRRQSEELSQNTLNFEIMRYVVLFAAAILVVAAFRRWA